MTFLVPVNASTISIQVTKLDKGKDEIVGECWIQLNSFAYDEKKMFYTHLWDGQQQPRPLSKRYELEISVTKSLLERKPINMQRLRLLYKYGDDIRQEYFCLTLMERMNLILKANGLDLCLKIFRCILPPLKRGMSSPGMIEWVDECVPLSALLENQSQEGDASHNWYYTRSMTENPIIAFFRDANYDPEGPFFVSKAVMERYVRSVAGFSVLSYILGIGDRHMDNLLIHPGRFLYNICSVSSPYCFLHSYLPSSLISLSRWILLSL